MRLLCPLFQSTIRRHGAQRFFIARRRSNQRHQGVGTGYADSQGLRSLFFNVFVHINSLVGSDFDSPKCVTIPGITPSGNNRNVRRFQRRTGDPFSFLQYLVPLGEKRPDTHGD